MSSNDEQLEALKDWWRKNATAVVLGTLVALGGVGGWKFWQSHQISQAETASQLYSELSQLVMYAAGEERQHQADQLVQRLTNEFKGSVYADYGHLFAARLAVENDQLDTAAQHLQLAMDNSKIEAIQLVARLRLARIFNSQEQVATALSLLEIDNPGAFTSEFEALRGDLLISQGRALEAREAYQRALDASRATGETAPLVEMKLDSIAGQDDA